MGSEVFENSMLGDAPEFRSVIRSAQIVAATDVTVLVLGESGTGKELLAHALHQASHRNSGPFVTINCAALPENLVESELFGHRKGAFTGAHDHNPGRIRSAEGGTLFLDEIGELPLAIQAKLLRFLESGECQPVGEQTPHRVDVRVITATNRDLYTLVRENRFREDLYYRLNVVPLELPPLRQRHGDIALLLRHLTRELAAQHGLSAPYFTSRAQTRLEAYHWPGNIRELRNFCERMVVLNHGQELDENALPLDLLRNRGHGSAANEPFALPEDGISLDELEREMIRQALDRTHGNRSRAARLLGLSRDTLLYRIKKYALG
jgi:DNA-binding NtrC family response regulator